MISKGSFISEICSYLCGLRIPDCGRCFMFSFKLVLVNKYNSYRFKDRFWGTRRMLLFLLLLWSFIAYRIWGKLCLLGTQWLLTLKRKRENNLDMEWERRFFWKDYSLVCFDGINLSFDNDTFFVFKLRSFSQWQMFFPLPSHWSKIYCSLNHTFHRKKSVLRNTVSQTRTLFGCSLFQLICIISCR